MKRLIYGMLEAIFFLAFSILWCEFGYYYYVFNFNCEGWPELDPIGPGGTQFTRMMIISDTHIMGPIKSVKIDKSRREWQMQQAFSISNSIYQPDVIIFLGDLFDEASFSRDLDFQDAIKDFKRIFHSDQPEQKRIIIAGNHDVGFHNQMISYPYLLERFCDEFKASPNIELMPASQFNGLNLITSNSMSFYNDTCHYCSYAIAATNKITSELTSQSKSCAPILFTHIPLYRPNDTLCDYPSTLREVVKKKNIEGEDVIHSTSSRFLLDRLKPRLVLSGHTHMNCKTYHSTEEGLIKEITVTSYNHKYAEKRPGFLLVSANKTHIFERHCNVVEEWIIVSVYSATLLLICSRFVMHYRRRSIGELFVRF